MLYLKSLQLPIERESVLDLSYGIGAMTRFFLERNCRIVCVDGRPENIEILKHRLPDFVMRADLEPLGRRGRLDVVFCFGLLFHRANPASSIRNLSCGRDERVLLETVVGDQVLPLVRLLDEPETNLALDGLGCRPTPSLFGMALTCAGFEFEFALQSRSRHPDFEFDWLDNLDCSRDNHFLRGVVVASPCELVHQQLRLLLQAPSGLKTAIYFLPLAGARPERVWLDVGAHLGEKTFAAAEQDPELRVYAFEPNLKIAIQRMDRLSNYIMLPFAITEQDGSANFYMNACDAASSLLPFVPEGLNLWIGKEELGVEAVRTVPTMRLDTFMNSFGIDRVHFLKIEARGSDLAVVRSCGDRLRDIERIELQVQITPIPLYEGAATREETVRYLESAGFDLESSEAQNYGQEENLLFVRSLSDDPVEILTEARDLCFLRPLQPQPGWNFGVDWDNFDPLFRKRRRIWSHCNRRKIDVPLEFPWYDDLKLTLYLGNDTSRALFIGGSIDPNEFAFLDRFLQPGMIVVDAGANEGLYSLFAGRRVGNDGKVLAFEPSARESERLRANIARNALHSVEIFPAALGESETTATLQIATQDHSGQNTLGAFIYPGVSSATAESVPLRRLDDVLSEANIRRLNLLKIDVEGAETRLLRGAADSIRKYRPTLLFELSDAALAKQSSSSEELLQLIRSFGYFLYVFDSATGLPRLAESGETSDNMLAAPSEKLLPLSWCAPPRTNLEVRFEDLQPLSGKSAFFDIIDQLVFNNSSVKGRGPLQVATRPEQWSYAVGFPVNEIARRNLSATTGMALKLEADIVSGEIGIGIVCNNLSMYFTPESRHAPGKVEYKITVPYLPPDSILVVRNTAAGGMISKAVIRSLTTYLLPDRAG